MREMEYLRGLCSKYGSHYLKKYFGFSLRDIAKIMGITERHFQRLLKNKVELNKKQTQTFCRAFIDLKIEEKTKDFKEDAHQLWMKEFWSKQKNMLTIIMVFGIFLTMNITALKTANITALKTAVFLKPHKVRFLLYIRRGFDLSRTQIKSFIASVMILLTAAFFIFKKQLTNAQAKYFNRLGLLFNN